MALVLKLGERDTILIGDNIEIAIAEILTSVSPECGRQVKLTITAPREMLIKAGNRLPDRAKISYSHPAMRPYQREES